MSITVRYLYWKISIPALKYTASKSMFRTTNQIVEIMSRIIFFIMLKLTPALTYVPWSIYIYFNYFTTDLGNDAFELPMPIWLAKALLPFTSNFESSTKHFCHLKGPIRLQNPVWIFDCCHRSLHSVLV